MKRTSPVGPKGGGWAVMRNPESPSRIGTASGAAASRRRATPAAIMAVMNASGADAGEDAEAADEDVVGELVDQGGPRSLLASREAVHVLDEDAGADAQQHLIGAVEHDEGHQCDPADTRSGALDAAQQQVDRHRHQWDEQHHPDVDDQPGRDLVLHVRVGDGLTAPGRVEEEQHRPGERYPDQERDLGGGERPALGHRCSLRRIHGMSTALTIAAVVRSAT